MSTPSRYWPGVVGLQLLADGAGKDPLDAVALVVWCVREGGLPRPLAPSTRDSLIEEAKAYLEREAEAGRDPTSVEVEAAWRALAKGAAPVADLVPTVPSRT